MKAKYILTPSNYHIYQLQERLKKIGEIAGLKELGILDESMLDEDWDPEKHEVIISTIHHLYSLTILTLSFLF